MDAEDRRAGVMARLATTLDAITRGGRQVADWLAEPGNPRRAGMALVAVLLAMGLLLPPVSLVTRLVTWDYTGLRPGVKAVVPARGAPGAVEVRGVDIARPARLRLRREAGAETRLPALPAGHVAVSDPYRLDLTGPAPRTAFLDLVVGVSEGDHPFVDGYGWDGQRWRWLSPRFRGTDRVRIELPLQRFVPRYIVATLATEAATEVSAGLLPPPATIPAAMAELPILELRAYHLAADDGTVTGRPFPVPSRTARQYGVVDNLEGQRLRGDLVNNVLILPTSRQRHRDAIANIVKRDGLDGVVLDYRGVDGDLQPVYAAWLGRLASDLHRLGAELIVVVPSPHRTSAGWDSSPYNWADLAAGVDGLRVTLPDDEPLETTAVESLVEWALPAVERGKLQLAVPAQGRDIVDGEPSPVSYGQALGRILDMATSDAPDRITPGAITTVELPTVRQAQLTKDPATGMWRFFYWDTSRRQHTVWLNDAAGLQAAFEIAARYRLGRVALDGVSAGLDPGLWRMIKGFLANRVAQAPSTSYRLQWQLIDARGQVVQQATQPLEEATFSFRAPEGEGAYRLGVNLVTSEDRLAAIGGTADVSVEPPPPATPLPTEAVIFLEPTPETIVTAPVPRDEAAARRTPIRVGQSVATAEADYNAVVAYAAGEMRDRPDFEGVVITDLRAGDRLQIVARSADGRWLEARQPSTGLEGWVLTKLVTLLVPLDALPTPGTPGAATGTPPPPGTAPTRPPGSGSR